MLIEERIAEITKSTTIHTIGQLPKDIKIMVLDVKTLFKSKYEYAPTLSECFYILCNNLTSPDICKHPDCNEYAKFNMRDREYKYCCRKCSDNDPNRNKKIQEKRILKIDYHESVKKSNATRKSNGTWGEIMKKAVATRTANGWYEKTIPKIRIKTDEQINKRRETMLFRYGTTHFGGGRSKMDTKLILGYKFQNIQGYEDVLIYELLVSGIKFDDIIPCNRAHKHSFEYSDDGITHRYYPDVYVVSENKYYEAKSSYWYAVEKDLVDIKSKSVTTLYEMRIYDAKYAKKIRKQIVESNRKTNE